MDELGRARIAYEPNQVSILQMHTCPHPGGRGIEVTEDKEVIVELARLPQGVARDDGGTEERAHGDDLGIALLMLQREHADGRSLLLRQVDGPVTHLSQSAPATLRAVGTIEIEAADDTFVIARDRIAIRVVIGRTLRATRDFVVRGPAPALVVVPVGRGLRFGGSRLVVREANARVAVGQHVGRTESWAQGASHLGFGCGANWLRPRRAGPGGQRGDRDQRRGDGDRRTTGRGAHRSKRGRENHRGRPSVMECRAGSAAPAACEAGAPRVSVVPMSPRDLPATLKALFDAERAVRAAHDQLIDAEPAGVLPLLERATREALDLDQLDEDESSLRLVRISAVLGEMQGAAVVDLLIDILGCDEPEARRAAGEALAGLAWDRFKEVALGVERALDRLPDGTPALSELPYLLAELPEPGAMKLLARFLAHRDPDAVAAAVEALVEAGDVSAIAILKPLENDARKVQLEDETGTLGEATIGELVAEALSLLGKAAP